MLNKDQRDELKELLKDGNKKDLDIYYGSEFLAKEYLSLYKKYRKLKVSTNPVRGVLMK